jgi:peptidyl-prolyl cis-trans isomerase B (cyclophilin B)
MKRLLILILISFITQSTWAAKPKNQYVEIRTELGACTVRLYNETPLHRDNFLKLVKAKFYNGLLFHRVIENFMIQGGDSESRNAVEGMMLGNGDVGYKIPAEFNDSLFHKKGTLAAARDNNPEKASSGSQFYLVQGKVFSNDELDRMEEGRLEGRKIPEEQRKVYETIGGVPHLDQNYTVFGEIVKGIDMIDAIAAVSTDKNDRPLLDQKMDIRILKRREVRRLEKELKN